MKLYCGEKKTWFKDLQHVSLPLYGRSTFSNTTVNRKILSAQEIYIFHPYLLDVRYFQYNLITYRYYANVSA